ncbi:hypothetical protein FB451DRAFT_1173043 [Mycena latifolia]|nr:hypothetical protein FB451DRAFT_1173043 [Mycena latifolia]
MPTPGLDNHDAQQEKNNEKRCKNNETCQRNAAAKLLSAAASTGSDRLPPTPLPAVAARPHVSQLLWLSSSLPYVHTPARPDLRNDGFVAMAAQMSLQDLSRLFSFNTDSADLGTSNSGAAAEYPRDDNENKRPWNDELGPDQEDQEEDIHRNAQSSLDVTMYEVDVQRKKRTFRMRPWINTNRRLTETHSDSDDHPPRRRQASDGDSPAHPKRKPRKKHANHRPNTD